MSKYLSPGVYVSERDLSTIVPAVGTSVGALVGYSPKGSLSVTLITDRQQFIEEYGEPDILSSYFHYTALAFLENGTALYCLRVTGSNPLYSGLSVVDEDYGTVQRAHSTGQSSTVYYDESGYTDELFSIFAKDPGEWGDNISITISDVKGLVDEGFSLDTSDQYTFVINVYYTDSEGNISKVESWKVSRQKKVDGYGKQLYLEDKINGFSNYIVVADNTSATETTLPLENSTAVALGGGDDGSTVAASDIVAGWQEFVNPDDITVQILLDGGHTPTIDATASDVAAIGQGMVTIAETRRDCIAILSVPNVEAATPTNTKTYRTTTLNTNSSFAALYAPWCKINDSYNDRIVEVPPAGYVGSHYVLTDYIKDVWYAPAGFDRGTLNILGLTDVYTEGERDTLYAAGVNCLQTFRGYGHVIYGQKTLQVKPSALDRVNVRRLITTVERSVVQSLRSYLFENNDELTRFTVKAQLDEYLDRLSTSGAFQTEAGDDGYLVICDTTNNTPQVIDANELHVDVFLKPVRAAEFIRLQTIITKSGVSFNELISRGTII
jgi:phage tail sheath protein FI